MNNESLIEKLDALRQGYSLMTHERIALNEAFDLVNEHFAMGDASKTSGAATGTTAAPVPQPSPVISSEISDTEAQQNTFLVQEMLGACEGLEDLEDCMLAALVAVRPHLTKPVSSDLRVTHSLTYLRNMLDRRLYHESESEAAWCDDLLNHVKALQEILHVN